LYLPTEGIVNQNSSACRTVLRDNCRILVGQQWSGGKSTASSSSRTFEKAVACHESAEYPEAAAHRKKDGASELEIVMVESVSDLSAR